MKIRKNTKRSPLRYPASCPNAGEIVQTHNCKLNQSPWDVINFSLSNFSLPISAVPRRPPPLPQSFLAAKKEIIRAGKKSSIDNATNVERPILCSKANGKGWQCRRKTTNQNSLCDHHLSLIQTKKSAVETHSLNQTKKSVETKKPVNQTKKAVETKHDLNKGKKDKAAISSSVDECTEDGSGRKKAIPAAVPDHFYYYYSGFGPRWGKIRGESSSSENNIVRGEVSRNVEHGHGLSPALLSQFDDEDTESDDQIEVAAKVREKVRRRGRPPKKAAQC